MTTLTHVPAPAPARGLGRAVTDSATMLRRNLRHMARYPVVTFLVIGFPLVFLGLFVVVLGDTLGAGITGTGGRAEYLAYVMPGILLFSIAGSTQGTAIAIAQDMTEGIATRFRSMSISRGAVLTGHVAAVTLQTLLGLAVVLGIAVASGLRPTATPVEWVAAAGLLTVVTVALSWLALALGMVPKTVEAASNLPMPLMLLPFLGSGFVPTESMPGAMRWFAEAQPFTPMTQTLRGLLMGTPIGDDALIALVWCVVIGVGGWAWARVLYDRRSVR